MAWRDAATPEVHVLVTLAQEAAQRHGSPLGSEDEVVWETFTRSLYSNSDRELDLACFAVLTIEAGCWVTRAAATLMEHAWATMNDAPVSVFGLQEWLSIFGLLGWVNATTGEERPDGTITLYRGAYDEQSPGMSWTSKLTVAREFPQDCKGHAVFETRALPDQMLARFNTSSEDEYVLDPRSLEVVLKERSAHHSCNPSA
jgi:hypothetical protein